MKEATGILDEAVAGFAKGEYWKAWRIDQAPLIKTYCIDGRFPPGMWERSVPHGTVNKRGAPKLEPVGERGIVGDVRGHLASCIGIGKTSEGGFWAASESQAMRFDAQGNYVSATQLFAPLVVSGDLRYYSLSIQSLLQPSTFAILPDGQLGARGWSNPLYRYTQPLARYSSPPAGEGFPMVHPAAVLASGPDDSLYTAWNGNERGVRKFKADGSGAFDFGSSPPTNLLTDSGANGGSVDAQGRIYLSLLAGGLKVYSRKGEEIESVPGAEELGSLAVAPDGALLFAAQGSKIVSFRRGPDGKLARAWTHDLKADISALVLLKDGPLVAGFKKEDAEGAVVRLYNVSANGLEAQAIAARGLGAIESQCLDAFTQLKAAKGSLYYAAHKKIWSLAPGADRAELIYDPQWPEQVAQFEAFAMAPNGDIYLASHWNGSSRGTNVYRARKTDQGYGKLEYLNGSKPIYTNPYFVIGDMEVDRSGRLILRLYTEKNNPHGRLLSLFRWSADTGKAEHLLDAGTIAGGSGECGLELERDGDLLVAGGATRSVWRLAADGSVKWGKTYNTCYIPGTFDCRQPMGISRDSHGRIWVSDMSRNRIMCLDGEGNLLASYGRCGTIDDRNGIDLCCPAGLKVMKDGEGNEWLYVADVGNQRIVRFMVK